MSLSNPTKPVTEERLQEFYHKIVPYMGGGGGASAVSDLTDVELDNVEDGQVLKWNATDEVWENSDESGGSSSTVLSQTLTAGNTTVTFTNIPTSGDFLVDFYTSTGINYSAISTASGTITLTFEAQASDVTVYCELQYTNITTPPIGATVTPINSVQTWMFCASVLGLNYITLAEVLSNQPLITTLMNSNNAVDYMIRSTVFATDVCNNRFAMQQMYDNSYCKNAVVHDDTWLNAVLASPYSSIWGDIYDTTVPIMVSNTTPASGQPDIGEIIGYSEYNSSYRFFHAFDNNASTAWAPQDNVSKAYVGFKFDNNVKVMKAVVSVIKFQAPSAITYKLQSSTDGTTWVTQNTFTSSAQQFTLMFNAPTFCQYYRLYSDNVIAQGSAGSWPISALQFYGIAENV